MFHTLYLCHARNTWNFVFAKRLFGDFKVSQSQHLQEGWKMYCSSFSVSWGFQESYAFPVDILFCNWYFIILVVQFAQVSFFDLYLSPFSPVSCGDIFHPIFNSFFCPLSSNPLKSHRFSFLGHIWNWA